MGNKLKEYTVTVVQEIASDVRVNAKDEKEAEEKALETLTYQRENHRVVSKYCKVKKGLTNEGSCATFPKGVEHE